MIKFKRAYPGRIDIYLDDSHVGRAEKTSIDSWTVSPELGTSFQVGMRLMLIPPTSLNAVKSRILQEFS